MSLLGGRFLIKIERKTEIAVPRIYRILKVNTGFIKHLQLTSRNLIMFLLGGASALHYESPIRKCIPQNVIINK